MDAPSGLPVDIAFSNRMTRSLGSCRPQQARIRINAALRRAELHDILREVLCHELAHYLTYLEHGARVRPHGPEWRTRMASGGFAPRVRIPLSEILAARRKERKAKVRPQQLSFLAPGDEGLPAGTALPMHAASDSLSHID